MNETILLIGNATGTIPIQMVATTNWPQFAVSLFFGSIFTVLLLYTLLGQSLVNPITLFRLWQFNRITGRPSLLIRHNESGLFGGQMINRNEIQKIGKFLQKHSGKDINLILHTPGGEVFAGTVISKMLRNHKGVVFGYVPHYAMSGGTLLALSCDYLVMDGSATLGVVDPQLGYIMHYGSAESFRKLKKFKGTKIDDMSFMLGNVAQKVEKSIYDHIFGLTGDRAFTKFLVMGGVEHIYNVDCKVLSKFNYDFSLMSEEEYYILNKLTEHSSTQTIFGVGKK